MESSIASRKRPIISLSDFSPEQIKRLSDIALSYEKDPESFRGLLNGARVGLIFTAPSTRTRASFWSVATNLGCHTLLIGASDLQVTTGETWLDTGAVLAHYLDCVVVRTNGPQNELRQLAEKMPATINAVTFEEHPTQAIADLCALREEFGDDEEVRIAYLGQVNNTSRALAIMVSKTPNLSLDVYTPLGMGFSESELSSMNTDAERPAITQRHAFPNTPRHVNAVYTTRWESMGIKHESPDWLAHLSPFAVTSETMRMLGGESEPAFMHDLPAVRGQEVASEILDGERSLVPRQALHKASAAAAALLWSIGGQA